MKDLMTFSLSQASLQKWFRFHNIIDVANAALEKGLLVLTAKTKVRLLPPLTITDEEIEKGVAILADVLSK